MMTSWVIFDRIIVGYVVEPFVVPTSGLCPPPVLLPSLVTVLCLTVISRSLSSPFLPPTRRLRFMFLPPLYPSPTQNTSLFRGRLHRESGWRATRHHRRRGFCALQKSTRPEGRRGETTSYIQAGKNTPDARAPDDDLRPL